MWKFRLCISVVLLVVLPVALFGQFGGGGFGGGNSGGGGFGGGGIGTLTNIGNKFGNLGSMGKGMDSLQERDFEAEKVRLSYHRLFERKFFPVDDSSFNPRREEFFIPYGKNPLGNYGNAVYDYVFDLDKHYAPGPNLHFSPYSFYRLDKSQIRIYDAIRPFGSLGYLIGSLQQQILSGSYTQNISNRFNIFFDYQFANSPGYFKNQTANNSKLALGFQYRAYKQRYLLTAFIIRNNVVSNENAGVVSDEMVKNTEEQVFLTDRTTIPVRLGDNVGYTTNPFNLTLFKGRREKGFLTFVENAYRIGKTDSTFSPDSTKIFIFKPRITASHILEYETVEHSFLDNSAGSDLLFYRNNLPSIPVDSLRGKLRITDKWRIIRNKLQLRYFPKLGNNDFFWQAQLGYDAMRGTWLFNQDSSSRNLFNLYTTGLLQMLVKKWNFTLRAFGTYYFAGLNLNDFKLGAMAQKQLGKWGTISTLLSILRTRPLAFQHNYSAFNRYSMAQNEFNSLQIWNATIKWDLPCYNLELELKWNRLKNYVYQQSFDKQSQYTPFLDIPQLEIKYLLPLPYGFALFNHITLQPSINPSTDSRSFSVPLELPLLHTFHRFYYEHNFLGYLRLLLGLELRWNTPYYAPIFNPVYASLVQQKNQVLYNLPQIHMFMKTRIRKKFSLTIRVENLNSLRFAGGFFGPTNNNFVLPNFPLYAMIVQGGVVWDFVN